MSPTKKRLEKRRAQRARRRERRRQDLLGLGVHSAFFPDVPTTGPIIEYVTWTSAIPLTQAEIDATFDGTIAVRRRNRAARRSALHMVHTFNLERVFTLLRRVERGGKKGRSATRKLKRFGRLDRHEGSPTLTFENAWGKPWG